MKMKIGYIRENDLKLNPHLTERFQFKEATFTRRISNRGDRVYSKMLLYPVDYEEIVSKVAFPRQYSDEQRAEIAERMKAAREK